MKLSAKENWPAGSSSRPPAAPEQVNRKAVFEPHVPQAVNGGQDYDNNKSEMNSVADSEEWIGEDDRASDSIAPSVMSEPEFQRHKLLMQQPPRSRLPSTQTRKPDVSHIRDASLRSRISERPFLRKVLWPSL